MQTPFNSFLATKSNTFLLYLAYILVGVSAVYFGFNYFFGIDSVLHWDILSELSEVPVVIDSFKLPNETLQIPGKAFVVNEQYLASKMAVNVWSSYLFLGLFYLGFALILASMPDMTQTNYLIAAGIVIALVVSANVSMVFNATSTISNAVILVIILGSNYYFHAFNRGFSLVKRSLFYFLILLIIGLYIYFKAEITSPFLLLASYRTIVGLCLTTVFSFLVAIEILFFFLKITTSINSKSSMKNFMLVSFLYLINVFYSYLLANKMVDWGILYLSPFLIIFLSVLAGLYRKHKNVSTYSPFFDFYHSGIFTYCGLAIIAFATFGEAFGNANDPLQEALEDGILYSHLIVGFLFVVYVLLNFYKLFAKGLEVHKVVFRNDARLPLWLFRAMAIFVIMAMLFQKQFFPVGQAIAGHFNAVADYYAHTGDYKYAEIQYKLALDREDRNHKSNYALASLAIAQNDNTTAALYFRKALAKNPSHFAFEGLSRSFFEGERFFDAMFTLKEGLQKFPNSPQLLTDLAYLYSKANLPDSSLLYYELALKYASDKNIPATNVLGFWAKNAQQSSINGVLENTQNFSYNAFNANKIALQMRAEQRFQGNFSFNEKDSVLNVANFAMLYNQTLFQKGKGDILPLEHLAMLTENETDSEDLTFAAAIQTYYKEDKIKAFQSLSNWTKSDTSSQKAKYFAILLNTFIKNESEDKVISNPNNDWTGNILNQNPLNVNVVQNAIEQLNKANKKPEAYQVALNAINWRKNSPLLYRLYCLQSLKIGMPEYGQNALEKLKQLSEEEYKAFLPQYNAILQNIEKEKSQFK